MSARAGWTWSGWRREIGFALAPLAERQVFLGLDGEDAVFAIDLAGEGDPVEGPLAGRGKFMDLRFAGGLLSAADAGIAATAKAVFEWHRRHGFCSVCGQPSEAAEAGWKRICTACKSEHFPRTDPVTIMLPTFGDSCLLGRQAVWPKGRFSTLAGFMEPGESIEAACAREVKEEAGLTVVEVRYHSSQPWPFPTNLMIGLIVEVSDQNAAPDQTELEEVRWFTREELRRILQAQAQPQGSGGAWGDVEGVGVPPPLRCRAPADESLDRRRLKPRRANPGRRCGPGVTGRLRKRGGRATDRSLFFFRIRPSTLQRACRQT